ncbi:Periplasmic oligopeptide-binding protein precursor [Tsuneonella dongtanensis]|uniref:Periplasmic oligopeptide-binding protein n=1 Tax=Tsuneonella dongtanensis TaxID=692370 RepID=A0A1B2AGW2_9SPHN|nr:peptide ABC transporter substrate-binding protein [Tsuneonella dongtanensis]ANY21384.1 Periplasmic oligopeptide-binding protein precursor [Tsuneonella dongtanensis]
MNSLMSCVARILLAVSLLGVLGSCGSRERESTIAAREGILLFGNGTEPKALDPHIVTGVPENHVISALIEGLVAYHPTSDLESSPGMAERWESNADFTKWTFYLRDAKWTNGDPVRAQDFVYSWQRILSPELGGEYAPMLYVIKNAEAYNTGKLKDFSQVGVKALDDRTLEVTLGGSTSYFPLMLQHYSFFPVNPRAVEAHGGMTDRQSGWSTIDNFVGNGPFRLKKWVTNQVIEVERNPDYWDAKTVKLNGIRFFPIDNVNAEETMFRNDRLHLTNTVFPDKIPVFAEKMPNNLRNDPYLGTYFYRINVTRKPFDDVRVRRALALAIDKKLLVEKVSKGGQAPATGFVPQGIPGYTASRAVQFDPDEARRLLAEAGYPGGKGFPKTEIMINTNEAHRKIAEAIQELWRRELGIDVGIYNQEWKVYLDNQANLNYDLARAGWIADYAHPSTFVDMFTTGNGNNDTGWSNRRYDALIEAARKAGNEEERVGHMLAAEEILLADMPIIPIYWYTRVYLLDEQVKGWHPKLLDNHPYKHVWLEPDAATARK